MKEQYFIFYEDDGPSGICGQSASTCKHQATLFVFNNYEKMRDFAKSLPVGRRNQRVKQIDNVAVIGEDGVWNFEYGEKSLYMLGEAPDSSAMYS
jgi:hypothetical protein